MKHDILPTELCHVSAYQYCSWLARWKVLVCHAPAVQGGPSLRGTTHWRARPLLPNVPAHDRERRRCSWTCHELTAARNGRADGSAVAVLSVPASLPVGPPCGRTMAFHGGERTPLSGYRHRRLRRRGFIPCCGVPAVLSGANAGWRAQTGIVAPSPRCEVTPSPRAARNASDRQ